MVHERPKMPAKTWSALRSHILADRKKKREKEGKQKEEERLKRERESRKKQEANNLEETKEQITMLEDKLASLKEEKHQLFLTLKKVLNEDDVRRKKDNEMNASMYGHHGGASNVLPMSGHVAQQTPTSRYIQPGQGLQQRQAMYRAAQSVAGLPPLSHGQAIKRIRSPSPPPASIYSRPAATYSAPSYMPPLITTQASGPANRDLLKEAVSQGLGLGVTPRERELLGALGGGHGLNRDLIASMGPVEREMLAKTLATGGSREHSQADAINLAAAAAKESENYARYLAAFQQQLEGGSKTAVAAAALSELDRARLVSQASSSSLPRPGYYSDPSRAFPSPR